MKMSEPRFGLALVASAAALLTTPPLAFSQTKGPAFDCARASGEVKTMICRDEALSNLDRKLDAVFKQAMTKARDSMPNSLQTEQRGWIKGRNECWKAQGVANAAYLTESWTATSVRECVEGNYKLRIAQLQAIWRLVPLTGPVFFTCDGNPANEVVATYFETEPRSARIERGDRTVTAFLVPRGSGSRYEGQNLTFWSKGKEAMVTWMGSDLKCVAR